MTRDEQFIIENAASGDDLDVLLATHRCAECAAPAFLQVVLDDGTAWLCTGCADEVEQETASAAASAAVARAA